MWARKTTPWAATSMILGDITSRRGFVLSQPDFQKVRRPDLVGSPNVKIQNSVSTLNVYQSNLQMETCSFEGSLCLKISQNCIDSLKKYTLHWKMILNNEANPAWPPSCFFGICLFTHARAARIFQMNSFSSSTHHQISLSAWPVFVLPPIGR